MMRALVTGSAGFIGRHMVRELEDRGWNVDMSDIAYHDNMPMYGNFVHDALGVFQSNGVPYLRTEGVYDLVVHAAYHVGGRAAIDGTNTNFAKNLQLDGAMFDWAVRTKQKRVLYFSSSAAYPVYRQRKDYIEDEYFGGKDPLREDDINLKEACEPDANYGWAKLTGERLAEDARRSGLAVTVVRPFSGYGEDQSDVYPFPSIVARAKVGNLSVWGPRGQTRDWIHVSDVVAGALAVVESETTDPVNLCTGRGVEMGELAYRIWSKATYPYGDIVWSLKDEVAEHVIYDESKPTGVFYRVGDPTRMLQYYEPKISLEEGISRALRSSSATQG